MVLNEMEFLLSIDLVDFSSDIHASEYLINSAQLFLNFSKGRGAFESAADCVIPIPGMFPEYFFVPVLD